MKGTSSMELLRKLDKNKMKRQFKMEIFWHERFLRIYYTIINQSI
jgi:hypothetical protein